MPRFRHTAVARNQLKRRLRELARQRLLPSDIAADLVIRVRPEAYEANFAELADQVDRVLAQLARWRATVSDDEVMSDRSNAPSPLPLPSPSEASDT